MEKLEELELKDIRMMTNLKFRLPQDPAPEDFDETNFKHIFCDSLKHLKRIRIVGDYCFVTKEQDQIAPTIELFDVLVDSLEHFTNLSSLGFDYDVVRTGMFVNKLPDIYQYLQNISRLDLSHSDLEEDIQKMRNPDKEYLKRMKQRRINQDKNYIGTMRDIGQIVLALLNLTELDLSYCNLSMESFKKKSDGWQVVDDDDDEEKYFDFKTKIRWNIRGVGIFTLSMVDVIHHSTIKTLDITGNNFSADDIKEMEEPFKKISFLYTLEEEDDEWTTDEDEDESARLTDFWKKITQVG